MKFDVNDQVVTTDTIFFRKKSDVRRGFLSWFSTLPRVTPGIILAVTKWFDETFEHHPEHYLYMCRGQSHSRKEIGIITGLIERSYLDLYASVRFRDQRSQAPKGIIKTFEEHDTVYYVTSRKPASAKSYIMLIDEKLTLVPSQHAKRFVSIDKQLSRFENVTVSATIDIRLRNMNVEELQKLMANIAAGTVTLSLSGMQDIRSFKDLGLNSVNAIKPSSSDGKAFDDVSIDEFNRAVKMILESKKSKKSKK